jgi:hypothetical protein
VKRFNSSFAASLVVALVFMSCAGDDYDPSATGKVAQGKLIESQSKNKKGPSQVKGGANRETGLPENPKEGEGNLSAEQSSTNTEEATLENDVFSEVSEGVLLEEIEEIFASPTNSSEVEPSEDNSPPAPEPIKSTLPPLAKDSPFREVSFRSLSSFPYEVEWDSDGKEPDPTAFLKRVPREVRQFNGSKVAMEGFMMPTMVNEDNKVTEFLLMPDQMSCCYGKAPAANGWIVVNSSKGVEILMDQVIRVTGSLMVEERWDEEFFQGLYHLDCEKITGGAL